MNRVSALVPLLLSVILGSCVDSSRGSNQAPLNSLGEETPVYFVEPAAGFSSGGTQEIKVWVAKGYYEQSILDANGGPFGPGDVVVVASGASCAEPITASIKVDGSVAPVATNPHGNAIGGYYWTVTLDLSSCRCSGGRTVTHHCDGCGHTFDTCEDGGECTASDVTIVAQAFNQPGNNKCVLHDFDSDGTTDCDVVTGTVAGGEGGEGEVVEKWVPAKFWAEDNTVCLTRSQGNCDHPVGDQGGKSCDE